MHLERLLLILEATGQRGDISVPEICETVDLPKPTAYRLVQELVSAGLLEPVSKGRFSLGTRLWRIAKQENSDRHLLRFVAPALKRAAEEHGVTFFFSRLRGRSVEISHVETPETGVSYLHPGLGRRPLHACSCSKAVAAFAPEALSELEGRLKAYTEFTLTRIDELEDELEQVRRRGYAECVEEIERGMCSVAAPLATSGPGTNLSIGAAGSVRVFTRSYRSEIGAYLVARAKDLNSAIGWAESEPLQAPKFR